ncbi:MAG TPA: hypothetical protein VGG55_06000, partial [Candidatus Acidoferrales bacterium]
TGAARGHGRLRARKRPAARKRSRADRTARAQQLAAHKRGVRLRTPKPAAKPGAPPAPLLHRFCKPSWAVLVERQPSQQGTRFVCPFCSQSHRVSGPVRGFRKVRRAQWIKLRRVEE